MLLNMRNALLVVLYTVTNLLTVENPTACRIFVGEMFQAFGRASLRRCESVPRKSSN